MKKYTISFLMLVSCVAINAMDDKRKVMDENIATMFNFDLIFGSSLFQKGYRFPTADAIANGYLEYDASNLSDRDWTKDESTPMTMRSDAIINQHRRPVQEARSQTMRVICPSPSPEIPGNYHADSPVSQVSFSDIASPESSPSTTTKSLSPLILSPENSHARTLSSPSSLMFSSPVNISSRSISPINASSRSSSPSSTLTSLRGRLSPLNVYINTRRDFMPSLSLQMIEEKNREVVPQ